jgi:hypothetical protein
MWKFRGHILCAATTLLVAVAGACSSSTSPSSSSGGTSPGSAAKGDTINFSGTYDLVSFTEDSTDGGSYSVPANSSNGATLVLTSADYTLTWTGSFATSNGSTPETGTYTAVDTSSAADRGTIALSGSSTQNGTYLFSTDTLTITLPQSNSSGVTNDVTVWVKQ